MHARPNERGAALVVSLLVVLVIALIAVSIAVSTRGGERVATAFQNQQRAFEAALAGLEDAREQLRLARYNTALTVGNYNSQLAQAANGGTLVNSTRLLEFRRDEWVHQRHPEHTVPRRYLSRQRVLRGLSHKRGSQRRDCDEHDGQ